MALDELAARMREGEQVELGEFLEQHGHQSDWPWDGRGRCWSEDATPLRSELARRSAQEPVPRTMATEASDASLVAAALEEDDELLTRSYALFRVALRAAARCSGVPAARWEDCLELTPSAWEQLLEAFDLSVWQEQVRIGRETARRWLGQALLRGEQGGHELTGTAVVAGRLTAPVRVLPSAGADGGPDWGEILVVPSIQPADAVVFPRLAGLIVEAGDLLGHAAVLAREAGVPCVVGVRGACARLAATGRATLDATAGVVRPDD
jgi:phosphohistidine swiveling domain-containing protein